MNLWNQWYRCIRYFQPACSRSRTYMFLVLILVGFSIRSESAGVTSFIRVVCLEPGLYKGFLHFFNYSTALDLRFLTEQWHRLVHRLFPVLQVGGYDVYVADGLKIAKEGKKMPGVKKLHQSSENNSKAPYIMGHSFQALAMLVRTVDGHAAAVPLTSRIHERLPNGGFLVASHRAVGAIRLGDPSQPREHDFDVHGHFDCPAHRDSDVRISIQNRGGISQRDSRHRNLCVSFLDESHEADSASRGKAIPAQEIRIVPGCGQAKDGSLSPICSTGMHRAGATAVPFARSWEGSVVAISQLAANHENEQSPFGAGGFVCVALQPVGISREFAPGSRTQENDRRKHARSANARLSNGCLT